jgi:hypothetical protein
MRYYVNFITLFDEFTQIITKMQFLFLLLCFESRNICGKLIARIKCCYSMINSGQFEEDPFITKALNRKVQMC